MRAAQAVADPRLGSALAGIPSLTRSGEALVITAPLRTLAGRAAGAVRVRMPGDAEVARALHDARLLLVGMTLFDGGLVLLFGALFIRRVVEPHRRRFGGGAARGRRASRPAAGAASRPRR